MDESHDEPAMEKSDEKEYTNAFMEKSDDEESTDSVDNVDEPETVDQKLHRRLSELFRGLSSKRQIANFIRAPDPSAKYSIVDLLKEHSDNYLIMRLTRDRLSELSFLWLAVLSSCYESAELLVRSGADVDEPYVARTARKRFRGAGEKKIVLHQLLTAYPSPRNDELIHLVVNSGACLQARDSMGKTALHIAVSLWRVQFEVTRLLLEKGANVNAADNKGVTPLLVAAGSSKADELLPMLIAYGADLSTRDKHGRNVLHWLTSGDYEGPVDLAGDLIMKGASLVDESVRDRGYQPIHLAALRGNNELVKMYLDRGADVNAPSDDGVSPLHLVAGTLYVPVVRTLLERGADVEKRTTLQGETPLHKACSRNVTVNIHLLLSAGANMLSEDRIGNTPFALLMSQYGRYTEPLDGIPHARLSIGLMLQKLATLRVCQPSIELKDERIIAGYEDDYRIYIQQVEMMKTTRLFQSCTFFDLLTKCHCQIAPLTRNPEFEIRVKEYYEMNQFSVCANDLKRAFERAKRHYQIMVEQEDLFNETFDYTIPRLMGEKVISYLCKNSSCEYCIVKKI